MADKTDYYEALGITKDANDDQIKKAYRKLAKQYHPDANPGDSKAEAKFKEVSEAYSVLSDPQKRAAYDQYGHSAFDPNSSGGQGGFSGYSGFDANDIFESFFGGGFGDIFGGGARRNGPRRGADLQTSMQIEFEEAVNGAEKSIQITSNEACDTCKGSGAKPGTTAESCKQCNGTGQERVMQQTMFGAMTSVRTCSACRGTGKIIKTPCTNCGGSGKVRQSKTLQIQIPKGIDNGQSIRLTGKGEPGERGGPSGDLLITIYVKPHRLFTRNGTNLYLEVPITFAQAALGSEISIPTLTGLEKYTLKPGTQTGTAVTLKGKGIPSLRNNKNFGDLVATLKVTVPTQLTDRQKQLLKDFAESMGEEYTDHKKGFFDKVMDAFK